MTPSMTPGGHTPGGMTPSGFTPGGSTPSGFTPSGTTPTGQKAMAMATPTPGKFYWRKCKNTKLQGSLCLKICVLVMIYSQLICVYVVLAGHLMSMTPEQLQAYTWQREIDERNRPLSDEELDSLFPEGYKVLQPPAGL